MVFRVRPSQMVRNGKSDFAAWGFADDVNDIGLFDGHCLTPRQWYPRFCSFELRFMRSARAARWPTAVRKSLFVRLPRAYPSARFPRPRERAWANLCRASGARVTMVLEVSVNGRPCG